MFKLREMKIEGFGPYRTEQHIVFKPGLTYLTGRRQDSNKNDSNGSGKTSFISAICWGLFGATPENAGLRHVISNTKDRCTVWLWLAAEDLDLRVTRVVTKKKHTLEVEVASKVNPRFLSGDVRAIQTELERIIGCTFELFSSCLFLSESSATSQFLFATPAKRAELLSHLIDDEAFQIGAKIADSKRKQDQAAAEIALREHAQLSAMLQQTRADQQILLDRAKVTDQQERARVEEAQRRLKWTEGALNQRSQDLAKMAIFLEQNPMASLSTQSAQYRTELERVQRQQWENANQLATFHDFESGACPTCQQKIAPEWLAARQNHRTSLEEEQVKIAEAIRHWTQKVQECDRTIQQVRETGVKLDQERRAIEELRVQYRHQADDCHPRTYATSTDEIFRLQQRILDLEQKVVTKVEEVTKYSDRAKQYGIVAGLFSRDIRNYLFDDIRGKLEQWTQHYLNEINDTGISVRYPVEAAREKFEITVLDGPYSRDLSTYSRGENWRIAFALLLALRQVLWMEKSCKLDFLIIDDPIGGALDKTGTGEFLSLMGRIVSSGVVPTLFATVPKDEYCVGGNQVLEVTRTPNFGSYVRYANA